MLITSQTVRSQAHYWSPCILRLSSAHTNLSAAKPKINFISYCCTVCQAVTTKQNQQNKKWTNKKQKQKKKTNQPTKIFRLPLLQKERDYLPPSFCFTHMKIIPCIVVALLSALIKARNLFFLGESQDCLMLVSMALLLRINPKTQKLKYLHSLSF